MGNSVLSQDWAEQGSPHFNLLRVPGINFLTFCLAGHGPNTPKHLHPQNLSLLRDTQIAYTHSYFPYPVQTPKSVYGTHGTTLTDRDSRHLGQLPSMVLMLTPKTIK